jgi:DNA-binding response OmpR family regulator
MIMNTTAVRNDYNRKLVLVVEDDQDMNELMCALMSGAGFDTISAADGRLGIEMASEQIPDLILMDIMLPELDGIKACENLRKSVNTANIPVIMVSAKRDVHTKLASFVAGAKRYITKPFGVEELVDEVKKTFRQKKITENIDAYHGKCDGEGDFGVFPSDFENRTSVCDKEI